MAKSEQLVSLDVFHSERSWSKLGAAARACDLVEAEWGTVCRCNATFCDEIEAVGASLDADEIVVFTTSKAGLRLARSTTAFVSENATESWRRVSVDAATAYETILGWGGALTDAAAITLGKMASSEKILAQYYGPTGAEYSLGRVPVGSCDFSTHIYSYDDVDGDYDLVNFDVSVDSDVNATGDKLGLVRRVLAMSARDLRLFASPWSPPAWMTELNSTVGRPKLKGVAGGETHRAWANYLSRFLAAYAEAGVPFWGLTVQNEPAGLLASKRGPGVLPSLRASSPRGETSAAR